MEIKPSSDPVAPGIVKSAHTALQMASRIDSNSNIQRMRRAMDGRDRPA
jgi:hypothetical protein